MFFKLTIHLFLAVLGLRCCVGALESWVGATVQRDVQAPHGSDFSCWVHAQALAVWASVVASQGLWSSTSVVVGSGLLPCGIWSLWTVGSQNSSCREQGATLCCDAQASHCSGFSCCGAQTLEHAVAACMLISCDKWAWLFHGHVESSCTSDGIVSCIGGWILLHCTTREVPPNAFKTIKSYINVDWC